MILRVPQHGERLCDLVVLHGLIAPNQQLILERYPVERKERRDETLTGLSRSRDEVFPFFDQPALGIHKAAFAPVQGREPHSARRLSRTLDNAACLTLARCYVFSRTLGETGAEL